MTKPQFGVFNNYISWQSIAMVVVPLNLEASLISARYDYEDDFDSYVLSMVALSACSAIVWSSLFLTFNSFFSDFFNMPKHYIYALCIYSFFCPIINIFQIRERFSFKYKSSVLVAVVLALLTSSLAVYFVYIFTDKAFGRIVGTVLPTLIIACVLFPVLVKRGKHVMIDTWKYSLRICLPYIPHLLSLTLLSSMDRTMITRICGESENALYSLAYNCGSIITILLTSMNNAYAPWLGNKIHEDSRQEVLSFSKKYILLFSLFTVMVLLVTPEVLFVMGGNAYLEAKYVMPPVTIGCFCQFIYTMFVNVEQFKKKTVGMAFASASAALLNYILNLLLLPRYGYLAAAYTTLISYLWLLIIHMILVKRIKCDYLYDYRFILITVLVMIVLMLITVFLYGHNYIRLATVLGFGLFMIVFLLKKKEEILSTIKSIRKK